MIGSERLGHLLSHGDIVEIKPHWRFRFHQPCVPNIDRKRAQMDDLQASMAYSALARMLIVPQLFEDQYTVSDRILGKGHYGAVFLANEVSTSRQMACKIVNLDSSVREITGNVTTDIPGRTWLDRIQHAREGRKLVLREIQILSKLSHVRY